MVSKQYQNMLEQAQVYQQQLQSIVSQKEAMNMQLIEINKSLEELERTKEKEVYKISGPILIKRGVTETKDDLNEKKQLIDLRIKTLEKSEKRLKDSFEEIKEKLTKSIRVDSDGSG